MRQNSIDRHAESEQNAPKRQFGDSTAQRAAALAATFAFNVLGRFFLEAVSLAQVPASLDASGKEAPELKLRCPAATPASTVESSSALEKSKPASCPALKAAS